MRLENRMDQSASAAQRHVPVMLERVLDLLAPGIGAATEADRRPVIVDCTLGMGGHSLAMLQRFDADVIGIDRDPQALEMAQRRIAEANDVVGRLLTWHGTYDQIPEALADHGLTGADGILFDLGVSSFQLDERERGFAYSYDAPLDMRMDTTADLDASTVVNTYDVDALRRIIRTYGEEKFAHRIAHAIVNAREAQPLRSTGELVEVIRQAVPAGAGRTGGHPAKRTFQALRIEVNEELDVLTDALPRALESLTIGGRMVVMSYHSLEDKITKRAITEQSVSTAPPGFPVELDEHQPTVKVITRGTEKPTDDEISENPRAASAKVRAIEKTRPTRPARSTG